MSNFSLPEKNVKFILCGLAVMIMGFVMMLGGGSDDPAVFNPAMFDARRLVVSPVLVVCGLVIIIVSIMKVSGKKGDKSR